MATVNINGRKVTLRPGECHSFRMARCSIVGVVDSVDQHAVVLRRVASFDASAAVNKHPYTYRKMLQRYYPYESLIHLTQVEQPRELYEM